jgi:hypothetical protein
MKIYNSSCLLLLSQAHSTDASRLESESSVITDLQQDL